ncbi:tetratricopeptide repeat protein, partial [Candidatus Peregrinibacteria bacterium]|nr:tetratricopeptide repeat protein [Candidatus Peregrinibacteria bacterium]
QNEDSNTPIEIVTQQEIIDVSEADSKTYTEYIKTAQEHFNKGELNKAIEDYTSAVRLNPRSKEPLIALGNTYLLNNQPSESKATFRAAQDLDPYSMEIQIGLVRSYINLRDIEKAKEMLDNLEETDSVVQYYKGIVLILFKDFEGAKEIFTFLATNEEFTIPDWIRTNSLKFTDAYDTFTFYSEGEDVHLKTLLAKALSDAEEFEAAIPLLYDIIAEKNDYRDAWLILGYAYLNTNKILDSIDAFTQAKALNEDKPETLFFLGLAHYANNNIEKAIYYLEEADRKGYEPKDEISLRLGDLYLLKKDYEKSTIKYEETLSMNKKSMDVYVRAIWLNLNKLNNPAKALKLANIALEHNPEEPMSYNLVGWSKTALGDFEEANKYLKEALAMNPDFDAAHLNFGWLYELQGKTALAKEYYKRAYMLGQGGSIGNLAAQRYNSLTEAELKNKYLQVNISAPSNN